MYTGPNFTGSEGGEHILDIGFCQKQKVASWTFGEDSNEKRGYRRQE